MATTNTLSREEIRALTANVGLAFDDFHDILDHVTIDQFDAGTMEKTGDNIWVPKPLEMYTSNTTSQSNPHSIDGNIQDINEVVKRKTINDYTMVVYRLSPKESRRQYLSGVLAQKAAKKMRSDVNQRLLAMIIQHATVASFNDGPINNVTAAAELQDIFDTMGIPREDRKLIMNARDHTALQQFFTAKDYLDPLTQEIIKNSTLNQIANWDVIRGPYNPRIEAADEHVAAVVRGDHSSNIPGAVDADDNPTESTESSTLNLTVSTATGAPSGTTTDGLKPGDYITCGPKRVNIGTWPRVVDDEDMTYRVTAVTTAGTGGVIGTDASTAHTGTGSVAVTVEPAFVCPYDNDGNEVTSAGAPTSTASERDAPDSLKQYQNIDLLPGDGAAVSVLNQRSTMSNLFFQKAAVSFSPGSLAYDTSGELGVRRSHVTTKYGMVINYAISDNINDDMVTHKFLGFFGRNYNDNLQIGTAAYNQNPTV